MTSTKGGKPVTLAGWGFAIFLILVVLVFVGIRLVNDVPNLRDGVFPPEGDFDRRYAENPVLAYLHILPGMVYLFVAPFQVSMKFRERNLRRHRVLGRVVLVSGLITGVFAIVVGFVMPFGGIAEASASTVFGLFFLVSLLLAYRAIRHRAIAVHRRWMIRAFAVGMAVGLIRIVIGTGEAMGIGIADSFGAAFWIAFVIMALLAEFWLWLRPDVPAGRDVLEITL
jgi:uncharacterized membrane protein